MALDLPAITSRPAEPGMISRAPVDIRSLSLAVLAGAGIVLFDLKPVGGPLGA